MADFLSRQSLTSHEWVLWRSILMLIFLHWLTPMIDLFATDNAKCQKVCYRAGVSTGSYQTPPFYSGIKVYYMLFPPSPLIHKVIRKIKSDKATIFLMAPYWLRQFWLRDLL